MTHALNFTSRQKSFNPRLNYSYSREKNFDPCTNEGTLPMLSTPPTLAHYPCLLADSNPNNMILLPKTQNYMFMSSLHYQKTIKSYQSSLAKNLKDQCVAMNI